MRKIFWHEWFKNLAHGEIKQKGYYAFVILIVRMMKKKWSLLVVAFKVMYTKNVYRFKKKIWDMFFSITRWIKNGSRHKLYLPSQKWKVNFLRSSLFIIQPIYSIYIVL